MKNISNEYLMLRDEILHLSNLENQTINFLYVFVASVLAFSITQKDTIVILISYIVIIPAYKMVISHEKGIYKIGAYLYVFLEGEDFNWERRSFVFYETLRNNSGNGTKRKIQVFNYPFLFISTLIMVFFLARTNYAAICSPYELLKCIAAVLLYLYVLVTTANNKYYSISKYIDLWEKLKHQTDRNEKNLKAAKEISEDV